MFRGKHIWLLPLITALVVAGVGWWADGQLRRVVRQEIHNDLEATLNANVTALEIWMTYQKRIASSLAEEPGFKALALDMIAQRQAMTNAATATERARQLLVVGQFGERLHTLGYPYAQVVDTNYVIIADNARGRVRIGQPMLDELGPRYRELFAKGEPLIILPFKVPHPNGPRRYSPGSRPAPGILASRLNNRMLTNGPASLLRRPSAMQVAVPLKDNLGQIQGALVLVINPDAEFTRILSVARNGDSGETFAFDAEGLLLSESRFDAELKKYRLLPDTPAAVSALTLHLRDPGGERALGYVPETNAPLIWMVENAVNGNSGVETQPFRDYRGVPVVGAWRWLDAGFGIGTKVDATEAFLTLRMVRSIFGLLFLMLVLASLVILLFSYRQVLWRHRLTEAEFKARRLGQYHLVEKIGEGGMGSVYRARHALLRRETAIKLLPSDKAEPHAIQRFEQEVQLTCRLAHPNTIQVFDYGHTPDGIFYYAMEYLDGLNLAELVQRHGPQPEERVIHILRQVCGSLGEAHGLGLIHRDIKPANVFITDRGGVPDTVKVLDFGLVRQFGPHASNAQLPEFVRTEGIVGTPNFIAPETIHNSDQADQRSDIYSLGALVYFLLTGEYVFEAGTVAEVCRRHLDEIPLPPSDRLGKPVEADLEALVLKCIAKDPARRPQSAAALGDALAECAAALRWTPERRARWWSTFRQRAATQMPAIAPALLEKTIKIDFEERTP